MYKLYFFKENNVLLKDFCKTPVWHISFPVPPGNRPKHRRPQFDRLPPRMRPRLANTLLSLLFIYSKMGLKWYQTGDDPPAPHRGEKTSTVQEVGGVGGATVSPLWDFKGATLDTQFTQFQSGDKSRDDCCAAKFGIIIIILKIKMMACKFT